MAKVLSEFDSLDIPGNRFVKTRRILASEQALEIMRRKDINVEDFVKALQKMMRDFNIHWAYISQCRTEIQINITNVQGPEK